MEEFVETFHIDWKLMIAQIINFGLVFLVFYFLAAKPLRKLMKERTEEIEGGLVNAKTNEELLKATKTEYESALQKARLEADAIFNESKKEVVKKREEMLENAKKEVATMIDAGKKSLEQEKTKMVNDAKNELASLAILAAEKVMQEKNK
ncbi:MAG: F0F1 ATP synthase subunit B [Candidatus Pacebacteria bacterium]|nr:F0F1 ATP synthase subunit B [Candidatus Paceibacterota bacterium]